MRAEDEEYGDLDLDDPDDAPPPDVDEAELAAEAEEIIAAQARLAAQRDATGRRRGTGPVSSGPLIRSKRPVVLRPGFTSLRPALPR